jgi:flagellar biosynthesis chaperone FliJ
MKLACTKDVMLSLDRREDMSVRSQEVANISSQQWQFLQNQLSALEKSIQNAVVSLEKKEKVTIALGTDLEHMMTILIKKLQTDGK